MPSGFGNQRGGGACGGCLWSGKCFSYGRRHHLCGAGHDFVHLQGRRQRLYFRENVHKSALNALVLCGAIPVYVNPQTNAKLGISLGMEIDQVARAIEENPDAKAVLVNNPTYYGICSDLK